MPFPLREGIMRLNAASPNLLLPKLPLWGKKKRILRKLEEWRAAASYYQQRTGKEVTAARDDHDK